MKILFGVFDWGLGHATRDIPLITELLKKNEVHIVATGGALQILKNRFDDRCRYYDVPSLYPPYTKTRFFQLKFAMSCPRMLKNLHNARKAVEQILRQGFDKVISDCRYDVYDNPDNSYLINHQLRFKTPFGGERIFEKWLASRMDRYKYIIVPDFSEPNLSGRLSHGLRYFDPAKIKYIGILSHLKKTDVKEDIDYFISLSGPEPQRTLLEQKVISQRSRLKGKIVIAGGNPHSSSTDSGRDFEFYSFLNTQRQQEIMNRAKFVVSRPGYTTVMELAELGKKNALFMPTPGQTEQEYLGDYYESRKYFHHVSQYQLELQRDIENCVGFTGFNPPWRTEDSVRQFSTVLSS